MSGRNTQEADEENVARCNFALRKSSPSLSPSPSLQIDHDVLARLGVGPSKNRFSNRGLIVCLRGANSSLSRLS